MREREKDLEGDREKKGGGGDKYFCVAVWISGL